MVFLVDQFKPSDYDESFFHKETYQRLKEMSKDNAVPHIIFHGPTGAGKKFMTNAFLTMIYGESISNLYTTYCSIPGSGNKVKTETIRKSNHHIVINPTGTNFDRYLVHEVIKKYASTNTLDFVQDPMSKFRTIQISDLDKLSHNAQTSLRRMIEVNANKCRFIMWCNNLSNVIGPLRSRCVVIRVPRPQPAELFAFLVYKAIELKTKPDMKCIMDIVRYSEQNIKTALWYLQIYSLNYDFRKKNNFYQMLDKLVGMILKCDLSASKNNRILIDENDDLDKNGELTTIESIRNVLFNMMITNYDAVSILRELENRLIQTKGLSEECRINIILIGSQVEYQLIRGRRDIIHFDQFVTQTMHAINMSRKLAMNQLILD
jgi:replication factor C subunit 3/5